MMKDDIAPTRDGPLTLFKLAYTSHLFVRMGDDSKTWREFQTATKRRPNLKNDSHAEKLIWLLNQWGCRQFALKYHATAKRELQTWIREWVAWLPSRNTSLLGLSNERLEAVADAFDDLRRRTASRKKRRGKWLRVTVSATGAAKVLYMLRPKAFLPWDEAIRDKLGYGKSGAEYVRFMRDAKRRAKELVSDAKCYGITAKQIPTAIGRKGVSLARLIDAYYWVTLTRDCNLPSRDELRKWLKWSG